MIYELTVVTKKFEEFAVGEITNETKLATEAAGIELTPELLEATIAHNWSLLVMFWMGLAKSSNLPQELQYPHCEYYEQDINEFQLIGEPVQAEVPLVLWEGERVSAHNVRRIISCRPIGKAGGCSPFILTPTGVFVSYDCNDNGQPDDEGWFTPPQKGGYVN